tara:strand:+ start:4884 stop:5564 length:681 start_codon:yes stop_codon:yes gene_type:complete
MNYSRGKKKEKLKIKKLRMELSFSKISNEEAQFIFDECREEFGELFTTKQQKEFDKKNPESKKPKDDDERTNTDISARAEERRTDESRERGEELGGIEDVSDVEEALKDKDIKDIFKKIALKTHPDRLEGVSDEEKEEKTELYKLAAAASRDGDGGALLEIAYELGLDIEISAYKEEKWLKRKIKQINKTMMNIKQDVRWIWFHTREDGRPRLEEVIEKQTIFTKK